MQLTKAFREGDPAEAWGLAQELLRLTRKLTDEAAQSRFKVNLGTATCERCDGLKAGEDVTATCFQLKRCYYGNVKTTDASSKQKAVIEGLLGTKEPRGT